MFLGYAESCLACVHPPLTLKNRERASRLGREDGCAQAKSCFHLPRIGFNYLPLEKGILSKMIKLHTLFSNLKTTQTCSIRKLPRYRKIFLILNFLSGPLTFVLLILEWRFHKCQFSTLLERSYGKRVTKSHRNEGKNRRRRAKAKRHVVPLWNCRYSRHGWRFVCLFVCFSNLYCIDHKWDDSRTRIGIVCCKMIVIKMPVISD